MAHICTFFSVSDALCMEKALIADGIPCKVIPVPRELSSSCGYAVEFHLDNFDVLQDIIKSNEIDIENIYQVIISSGKAVYTICK